MLEIAALLMLTLAWRMTREPQSVTDERERLRVWLRHVVEEWKNNR